MTKVRVFLWVLVALALIGAGVALLWRPSSESPPLSGGTQELGGPFTLTGVDGRPFSSSKLAGKPFAIFFGFTHCPDVCPTTLARLVKLRRDLNAGGEPFAIVFVTVDPERDSPQELGRYVTLFGDPVIGLTGTATQIDRVKKQYGIYSQKAPDGAGGYSVDHTATALLFDGNGRFVATISPEEGDSVAKDKLRRAAA